MLRTLPLVTLLLAVSAGCGSATETKTTTAVKAEKSVKTVTSKPAVDTSQLQAAPTWALVDLAGKPVTSESLKGKVVIVDFWATWCGPCHMVAPEVQKAAEQLAGRALVFKVDTDANPELSQRFQIRSIPTIAAFDGGREVRRTAGVQRAAAIQALVATQGTAK